MKLDLISDISCPWCVIGYLSLGSAIASIQNEHPVTLEWQPFELNPTMPTEGEPLFEHLQKKYGLSWEQVQQNQKVISDRAESLGFTITLDAESRIYNTFDAHRLLQWAADKGAQTPLYESLLRLYFTDRGNPSDHQALLHCAERSGLDPDLAKQVLDSDRFAQTVRARQNHYHSMGVNSVPTLILDQRYSVVGAQSIEVYIQALKRVATEMGRNHD